MSARCLATLTLDADQLVDLFRRTARERVVFAGIPEDAVVVGVSHPDGFNRVRLYLESATFPVVPENQPVPELGVQIWTGKRADSLVAAGLAASP